MSLGQISGGEGGIRTPGTRKGTTDFESVPFGHSGTSPLGRDGSWGKEPENGKPTFFGKVKKSAAKSELGRYRLFLDRVDT